MIIALYLIRKAMAGSCKGRLVAKCQLFRRIQSTGKPVTGNTVVNKQAVKYVLRGRGHGAWSRQYVDNINH